MSIWKISELTDVDGFAKLDDDGRHEQDGRHVVEDGRHDGRDQAENGEKRPNLSFGYFEGPQTHPVEETRFGKYRDNYHHTEEQSPVWNFHLVLRSLLLTFNRYWQILHLKHHNNKT